MNDEQKGEIIRSITENILATLKKQDFADWYGDGGRFDAFIRGGKEMEETFGTENYRVAEVLIMQDIHRLFNI